MLGLFWAQGQPGTNWVGDTDESFRVRPIKSQGTQEKDCFWTRGAWLRSDHPPVAGWVSAALCVFLEHL